MDLTWFVAGFAVGLVTMTLITTIVVYFIGRR